MREISRNEIEPNTFIVQRVKNDGVETIKEMVSSTGERAISEIETVETITITRIIGGKIQF